MEDEQDRTLFCGNLNDKVTEELLYELFLQAGPIDAVRIPKKDGKARNFAFIIYRHRSTIPYALRLYEGTKLFGRNLTINSRNPGEPNRQGYNQRSNDSRPNPGYNHQRQSVSNPETPVTPLMPPGNNMGGTPFIFSPMMGQNTMFLPVLEQQLAAMQQQHSGTPTYQRQFSVPEQGYHNNRNNDRRTMNNEQFRRRPEPYYNNRNRR